MPTARYCSSQLCACQFEATIAQYFIADDRDRGGILPTAIPAEGIDKLDRVDPAYPFLLEMIDDRHSRSVRVVDELALYTHVEG